MDVRWYARRLAAMSPSEMVARGRDQLTRRVLWARRNRIRSPVASATFTSAPHPGWESAVSPEARRSLLESADGLLAGQWNVFECVRTDLVDPDWFLDPYTGRRAPNDVNAFSLNTRDPAVVGDSKYVWELSRHHQTTVLAAAFALTGEERYARAAAHQVSSWIEANRFLYGVQWTSGIEIGLRLIAWAYTRLLLAGWEQAPSHFEENRQFLDQAYAHQVYLHELPSHGSSANNHLIAEMAGLYTAACAFDWFPESADWRMTSGSGLVRELEAQTFSSGLNRELATDYHGFVLELALAAASEGIARGDSHAPRLLSPILQMLDALAAIVDISVRPPRQGDADEGHGYVFDGANRDRWKELIAAGGRIFGAMPWWPAVEGGAVSTALIGSRIGEVHVEADRPSRRPSLFSDAGMVIVRDVDRRPDEIWCRLDAGPHGFLSIAGHAHADALSVELRVGGLDVLADPGTYTYHGQPDWRTYFVSTASHSTLEIGGEEQSIRGGAFLWTHGAAGRMISVRGVDGGRVASVEAAHDGYGRLDPPVTHLRRVELDRSTRVVVIEDWIRSEGRHDAVLRFQLGPAVECSLEGDVAALRWEGPTGVGEGELRLPSRLEWHTTQGSIDPITGWYSPAFGIRVPTVVLTGLGEVGDGERLVSSLAIDVMSCDEG